MYETVSRMPSIVPHVLMDSRSGENQAPLDAMASEGCGSTVSTSTVATCWQASEEENEEKSTAEVEISVKQGGWWIWILASA